MSQTKQTEKKTATPLILVVDDEEIIRTLLTRALTSRGYDVLAAPSKTEAKKLLDERVFDLLIVDKNLPDGSGLDIISKCRRRDHHTEAIVITGYSDTDSAIQAITLGVFRYVRKPFDLDALQLDITNALETGRLRRDLDKRTEQLEKTNKELWSALQRAKQSEQRARLAERLATIGYLSAGVAHEINNPLSLLSMAIPYAVEELTELLQAVETNRPREQLLCSIQQLQGSLEPTQEAVEFLLRLAGDLKSLGRSEENDRKPVKLADVVDSATRLVRHQLKNKARVVSRVPSDLKVSGRSSRLMQVFINLLTNAGRAIENGPPEENEIKITGYEQSSYAFISVSDTGIGIPQENLDKIFDRFFTDSSDEREKGSGIGLALAKEIIEDHDGHITVTSRVGVGTTFTVKLPCIQESRTTDRSRAQGWPESRQRTILFVASDPSSLSEYEKTFGSMHRVLTAATFHKAATIIEQNSPAVDAIICELRDSSEQEFALARTMCNAAPELTTRLIFLSENGKAAHMKNRGHIVLEKPAKMSVLLSEIYKLIPQDSQGITASS